MILRLFGALLAATGLLGHGLAMLLVGALASPAAAGPDSRYFSEICTSAGIFSLAELGARDSENDNSRHNAPLKTCPVCSAYAQLGTADLPAGLAAPVSQCCGATLRVPPVDTPQAFMAADARPRAPPAST